MSTGEPRRFHAFISYSHTDEAVCSQLFKRLDGYQTPRELRDQQGVNGAVPGRLYPVFRDRDELATSSELPDRLRDALDKSESLVVLCSPSAVASQWVNEEIRIFAGMGKASRIYPVIVQGDPPHCFPAALRAVLPEPLAADLREQGDGITDGALKVVAAILGVPYARLKDREAARSRRRARINFALTTVFALLAVAAVVAALRARQELQRAERVIEIAMHGVLTVQEEISLQGESGKIATDIAGSLLLTASGMIKDVEAEAPGNTDVRYEAHRNRILMSRFYRNVGDLESAVTAAREAVSASAELGQLAGLEDDARRARSAALNEYSDTLVQMGRAGEALPNYEKSLAISRDLARAYPENLHRVRDTAVVLDKLGDAYLMHGNSAAARAAFEESLALTRDLARLDPNNTTLSADLELGLDKLAGLLWDAGDDEGATALYQQSLELTRSLLETAPDNARWKRDLSVTLNNVGDLKLGRLDATGAATAFAESVDIRRGLIKQDPKNLTLKHDYSLALSKLSDAHLLDGDSDEAAAGYREALAIDRQLVSQDPDNQRWLSSLSASLDRSGDLERDAGNPEAALALYQESLMISQRLREMDADNVHWIRGLAIGHGRIAGIQETAGDLEGALQNRRQEVAAVRRLAAMDSGNALWAEDLSSTLIGLGDLHLLRGEKPAALAAHEESLQLARGLLHESPADPARKFNLSVIVDRLADGRRAEGDTTGALGLYQEGLDLALELQANLPDDPRRSKDVAISLANLADTWLGAGNVAEAIVHYRQRLDVLAGIARDEPGYRADIAVGLGLVAQLQYQQGQLEAAASSLEEKLAVCRQMAASGAPVWRREIALVLMGLSELQPMRAGERLAEALALLESLLEEGVLPAADGPLISNIKSALEAIARGH